MQIVSWLGNQPQMFLIVASFVLLLLILKLHWEAFCLAFSGIGAYILDNFIKLVVQRPRPFSSNLSDWSFPSGHVLSFTACFGFLAYLAYTLLRPSHRRIVILAFLIGLIVLVGPSRVYLGEHWASDVFGSYFLGSIWLFFVIRLYNRKTVKTS